MKVGNVGPHSVRGPVGNSSLTGKELAILKNHALGMDSRANALASGSTAGGVRTALFRICLQLGIDRQGAFALSYCLFHKLLDIEHVYAVHGLSQPTERIEAA
jgi:hypothetical protein